METRKGKYTQEEDDIIWDIIEGDEESSTMKVCFIAAAERLNRSRHSVEQRYYKYLSNPESKHYKGVARLLLSKHRAAQNRSTFKYPIETKPSIWQRIKRIFGLF